MASIFEELMTFNQSLTESVHRQSGQKKSESRKLRCNRIKVESRQFFEEGDIDDLSSQFDIPEESEETADEVVLVIDPEIQSSEEIPEDAAEEMIGDAVYKCPVCGSNYVCDCDAETAMAEGIELDEFGVPIECPICGDDADQILVGEIAPAEDAGEEKEMDLQEPVDEEEESEDELEDDIDAELEEDLDISVSTDDEGRVDEVTVEEDGEVVVDEVVDEEESSEESEDEVVEESLGSDLEKYQMWVDYDMDHYKKISQETEKFLKDAGLKVDNGKVISECSMREGVCPKCGKSHRRHESCRRQVTESKVYTFVDNDLNLDDDEDFDSVKKEYGVTVNEIRPIQGRQAYKVSGTFDQLNNFYQDPYSWCYLVSKKDLKNFEKDLKSSRFKDSYDDIMDERSSVVGESLVEDLEDEVVDSDELVLDPITVEEPEVEVDEDVVESPEVVVKDSEVTLVLDDKKFESMMNSMLKENYKGSLEFKITKASRRGNTLKVEYVVRSGKKSSKGTLVGEGFDTKSNVIKVGFRDKGVFTESLKRTPIMFVEFVRLSSKVIPTKMKYDFKSKIKGESYRLVGTVGGRK